ncbi:MAG: RING finger protein [Oscillospiraceae bacterium]
MNFIGTSCVQCGHAFEDGDDVVVCPECGAPHHRSCYRDLGHCALSNQHASDFAWQAPTDPAVAAGKHTVVCPSCNTVNPKDSVFCQMCGTRLDKPLTEQQNEHHTDAPPASNAFGFGTADSDDANAQWEVSGISAREISTYVGNSTFYFLRQFQMLMRTKFNISWNWAAFMFQHFYFFYRKMYLIGIGVMVLTLIIDIPATLYSIEFFKSQYVADAIVNTSLMAAVEQMLPMLQFFNVAMRSLCALFANKFFLRKALSDITCARTSAGPSGVECRDYYVSLYTRGRPNLLIIGLVIGIYLLGSSALATYLLTMAGIS